MRDTLRSLLMILITTAWLGGCDDGDTEPEGQIDGAMMPADAMVADAGAEPADAEVGDDAAVDQGPPPEMEPALPVEGHTLGAPVEVRVDVHGLNHIYAQDDLDLFYASGYLQAVDRLFAMDVNRRAAMGTLAEIFGPERLSGDIQARVIGFPRMARSGYDLMRELNPEDTQLFVAFTAGVNRRVAEINAGEAEAPAEYAALGAPIEPFTTIGVLANGYRLSFGFSSTFEFDLLYSLMQVLAAGASELPVFQAVGGATIMSQAELPVGPRKSLPLTGGEPHAPEALEAFRAFLRDWHANQDMGDGSNGFVINGDHTLNGRPILANDSHAGLATPNIMWPAHLNSADAGGRWDAIGMAFTGTPGVQVGHNRSLAWGATTHFADMLDVWDVQVDDEGALMGDTRVPLETREEVIRVRQPDGSFETEALAVSTVPGHGVIIPQAMLGDIPVGLIVRGELLMGFPGFEPQPDPLTYFDFARAETLDAFEDAVGTQRTGMQNWMAITAEGMRFITRGLVPDRGPVEGRPSANRVMDASDASTLWNRGWLPIERYPYLDGSQPFISTANNDPWGQTLDNDPLNDEFYYGSFYSPGFRAARLLEVLPAMIADGPVDREALQALQLEVFSPWADRMIPMLDEAIASLDDDAALAEWVGRDDIRAAAEQLQLWDRQATLDSAEAALFRIWAEILGQQILADDLGLLYDAISEEEPVYVAKFSLLTLEQRIESLLDAPREVVLISALDAALEVLAERPGLTWGELHRAVFRTPDRRETLLATPGDDSSLNVAQSQCSDADGIAEHCRTTAGAVFRFVTHIADDGVPESRFSCPDCLPDSTPGWAAGEFIDLPFRRADVEAATAEVFTIE